jgi:hypothetical protein
VSRACFSFRMGGVDSLRGSVLPPTVRGGSCCHPTHSFAWARCESHSLQWGTVTIDTANGANAAKFDADKHNVILVFGGPGTYKGKLMSFLVNTQGFELISMEQMVRIPTATHSPLVRSSSRKHCPTPTHILGLEPSAPRGAHIFVTCLWHRSL